jgi:hypothetical protein
MLTRDVDETIRARAAHDPAFRKALAEEAALEMLELLQGILGAHRVHEMDDAKRRQLEDAAKQAGWDAYSLASGNGFRLTNEETYLVHKLVSDAIARSTDKTVQHEIGDASAVSTAMRLYMRLSEALPDRSRR